MKTSQPAMTPVPPEDAESPEPPALSGHGPTRIIVMCSQKGGVGKITTAINLSAALAGYGRRVLLVDFDPQGTTSVGSEINSHELDNTIHSLILSSHHSVTIHDVTQNTGTENLDLIPANIDLSVAELQLANEVACETILMWVLCSVEQDYDLIVIDCQPLLGLLTVDVLTAAYGVITPVAIESFALRRVALLVETVNTVRDRLNPCLQLNGISATMVDSCMLYSKEAFERSTEISQDKVFSAVASHTAKSPDSAVATRPIVELVPTHDGAEAHRCLVREMVAKGYVV